MTDSISSPTYSINEGALKLNLSQNASSTHQCNLSEAKGPVVMFEQYINEHDKPKLSHPKKHLKIQIDDGKFSFQAFEPNTQVQCKASPEMHFCSNKDDGEKNGRLSATYHPKEDKPRASQGKIRELQKLLQKSEHQRNDLLKQNDLLKAQLKKKEDIILTQQSKHDQLFYKLAQLQQIHAKDNFYDEKLREKEGKIRDMQKLYEKVVHMNKSLQKELRESDKKIFELEKQLQRSICHTQQENLLKIKENSTRLKESSLKLKQSGTALTTLNKQNNSLVNGMKSLERKKNSSSSSQIKKTGRVVSSSGNITKKLLPNK